MVVFSRNTSMEVRAEVQNILGMQIENKHFKYLGMPTVVCRTKKEIFSYLPDRASELFQVGNHVICEGRVRRFLLRQSFNQFQPSQ